MPTRDEYVAAAKDVRGYADDIRNQQTKVSQSGWDAVVTGEASSVAGVIEDMADLGSNSVSDSASDADLVAERLDWRARQCEIFDDALAEYKQKRDTYDRLKALSDGGMPFIVVPEDPGDPPVKPYPWITPTIIL